MQTRRVPWRRAVPGCFPHIISKLPAILLAVERSLRQRQMLLSKEPSAIACRCRRYTYRQPRKAAPCILLIQRYNIMLRNFLNASESGRQKTTENPKGQAVAFFPKIIKKKNHKRQSGFHSTLRRKRRYHRQ